MECPTLPLELHPARFLPTSPDERAVALRLYEAVRELPIVSPHGHTDPAWFADDAPFPDPVSLLVTPDHYVLRMLYSQGVPLEALGVQAAGDGPPESDKRLIWRLFAAHAKLFRGTPSRLWLDHVLHDVFGVRERLGPASADRIYDLIASQLATPAFRPRALYERFRIEVLATTDGACDSLSAHRLIQASGWPGRVIPCFRPDAVVDPDYEGFADGVARLGEVTREDTWTLPGYLAALAARRRDFIALGATATDHGHPTAVTADLAPAEAARLFQKALSGKADVDERELFRGHMLTEMARLSLEDGLVMQLHPGSFRNHNGPLFERFGRDKGADIPRRTDFVTALRPLLGRYGNDPRLTLIVFTLDESTYARELAPLAGHYPALKLGPAWWFHDSPEGMRRYRQQVTETAGFYNTVGFNDDTRAFLSIPARHDMARRMDCAFLSQLVCDHRLPEDEASDVAVDLAYRLAKTSYKL